MKATRFILCILLSVTLIVTFIPILSFAESEEGTEPVDKVTEPVTEETVQADDEQEPGADDPQARRTIKPLEKDNIATKQFGKGQLSEEEMSQIEAAFENQKSANPSSYSDPVYDNYDDPWIMLYYPDPWETDGLGSSMFVDYDIYDVWEEYYTIPVIVVSDFSGNVIDVVIADEPADIETWTNYTGFVYLDPADYRNGSFYELDVWGIPCYSSGTFVEDWADWAWLPIATTYFEVQCYHSWRHYFNPAGLLKNGNSYDQCTMCWQKNNVRTLAGYAKYYVKSFKISKGKKSITAKWKKQSKANQKKFNGYQIRYSLKSNMSGAKAVTAAKSSKSKKIGGLKAKKTYYVQVRTYTKKGGQTFYSKWSKKKSVKTK